MEITNKYQQLEFDFIEFKNDAENKIKEKRFKIQIFDF